MVQKCANPRCDEPFRSLKQGKLFTFSSAHGVVHYWLCFICSRKLSLVRSANGHTRCVKQDQASKSFAAAA
jgi:hypothetical protein